MRFVFQPIHIAATAPPLTPWLLNLYCTVSLASDEIYDLRKPIRPVSIKMYLQTHFSSLPESPISRSLRKEQRHRQAFYFSLLYPVYSFIRVPWAFGCLSERHRHQWISNYFAEYIDTSAADAQNGSAEENGQRTSEKSWKEMGRRVMKAVYLSEQANFSNWKRTEITRKWLDSKVQRVLLGYGLIVKWI